MRVIVAECVTVKEILRYIRRAARKYGQSRRSMIRVARCESNLDPCAYNRSGPYFGLYQFLEVDVEIDSLREQRYL